jgi:hypothetical protein
MEPFDDITLRFRYPGSPKVDSTPSTWPFLVLIPASKLDLHPTSETASSTVFVLGDSNEQWISSKDSFLIRVTDSLYLPSKGALVASIRRFQSQFVFHSYVWMLLQVYVGYLEEYCKFKLEQGRDNLDEDERFSKGDTDDK